MDKLTIELEPQAWHGYSHETVWATRLEDGLYKVENSPFFARGVSYEDTVLAVPQKGLNMFVRTVASSGGSTYRIIPNKGSADAQFQRFWKLLETEGCTYEQGYFGYTMYAVDVPRDTDLQKVYALLNDGLSQKVWEFEEGKCGHKVPKR